MRVRSSLVALSAGALLLTACSSGSPAPGDSSDPGGNAADAVVSIAVPIAPGLNPLAVNDNSSNTLRSLGFSYLVSLDPQDGSIQAGIASSWEESPEEIVFTLRDDVVCSDGSPITPSVAAKSFEWVLTTENGSPLLGSSVPRGATVSADDSAGTLTLTTATPNSFALSMSSRMPILCGAGADDPESLTTTFSGSGMYALSDFVEGQEYTYTLRDEFAWGPNGVSASDPGVPGEIVVSVVSSEPTVANMLTTGEVNIGQISGTDRSRLDGAGLFSQVVPARPGLLLFNQAEGRVGSDIAAREALTQAIDLDELGAVGSGGFGVPLTSITVAEPAVCTSDAATKGLTPAFDATAAASALDSLGWSLGADGNRTKDGAALALKMLYPSNYGPAITSAAELLQTQLAEVGAVLELVPSDNYASVLFSGGDWDIVWAPLTISLPTDWQGIFTSPAAPEGQNFASVSNSSYAALTTEASGQVGVDSCGTWQQAEEALLSNLDIIPVVSNTNVFYGSDVTFDVSLGILVGTSIRVA